MIGLNNLISVRKLPSQIFFAKRKSKILTRSNEQSTHALSLKAYMHRCLSDYRIQKSSAVEKLFMKSVIMQETPNT